MATLDLQPFRSSDRLRKRSWIPWLGKGSLAIADQGIFAGSNFLLNVLLARWLAPAEYGAFALAYSVFLLLLVVHDALFTSPMLVFGSSKYREQFARYLGILLRGHFAFALPGAVLLAAIAFVIAHLYSEAVGRALLSVAIAAPFILLVWLLRRAFYAQLTLRWAVGGGCVQFVVLFSSVLTFRALGYLTAATGLVALGGSSLVTSLLLLVVLRPTLTAGASSIRTVWTEHWGYGKWILAAAGPTWLINNIYYLVLPMMAGLAEAGALKALMNLAMPALQSVSALGVLLMPILVRERGRRGHGALKKMTTLAALVFATGSICYLALLLGFGFRILRFLYAGKYVTESWWLLLLVGLLPLVQSVPAVLGAALGSIERPDLYFWAILGGVTSALLLGVPIALDIGLPGALVGFILSFGTTAVLMFTFLVVHPIAEITANG